MDQTQCCFTGYRPEKMPAGHSYHTMIPSFLYTPLQEAIVQAYTQGCTTFLTGMSRGFDLWAAQMVLLLQKELSIQLVCVLPFAQHGKYWTQDWQAVHERMQAGAVQTHVLAPHYFKGCYHVRNRWMVERAGHMICYYDGQGGGTAQTVQMAKKKGLWVHNLADTQLTLW